jgi:hypothetical protein
MSNSVPFKCPVDGCKFNKQITYADIFQIKWHIKHVHGYGELIETAVQLEIIRDDTERRNPDWLTDRLLQVATKCMKNEASIN